MPRLLDLPENPILSNKEVTILLGLTSASLSNWKNRKSKDGYALKSLPNGKYNLVDVANFITRRTTKGKHDPTLRPKAQEIIDFYGQKDPPPTKPTVLDEKPTEEPKGDLGIEHALQRVQKTEVILAQKVEEAYNDPGNLVVAISNWNKILEILRKTETDCLKVMEEKGVLVRIDDVVELYNKGVLPVKTRLQQIPSSIAVDLVDQDRATIEEILEKAIDRALEGIADIWGEDDK